MHFFSSSYLKTQTNPPIHPHFPVLMQSYLNLLECSAYEQACQSFIQGSITGSELLGKRKETRERADEVQRNAPASLFQGGDLRWIYDHHEMLLRDVESKYAQDIIRKIRDTTIGNADPMWHDIAEIFKLHVPVTLATGEVIPGGRYYEMLDNETNTKRWIDMETQKQLERMKKARETIRDCQGEIQCCEASLYDLYKRDALCDRKLKDLQAEDAI